MSASASEWTLASHMRMAGSGFAGLCRDEGRALWRGEYRRPWRRLGLDLLLFPVLGTLLGIHWVCLWLDEVLFPASGTRPVGRPVFIIGPPRSGTTHLHRVMARDRERFRVSPTWEVFLAPSVVQKKLLRGLLRLDRRIGRPLARLVRRVERNALAGFDETHPSALAEPEEDYFYLSALMACSGWILLCPSWRRAGELMPGSGAHRPERIRQAVAFYDLCLRKQQYVEGGGRTVLSKNASFSSWLPWLRERFPDARYVVCMRPASETVPSMLSTSDQARASFAAGGRREDAFRQRLVAFMGAHYDTLRRERSAGKRDMFVCGIDDLKYRLPEVLRQLSGYLEIDFSSCFLQELESMGERSRRHRSPHAYTAADYGLDPRKLDDRYPPLRSDLETSD